MSQPSINSNNDFVYVYKKEKLNNSKSHQKDVKISDNISELEKNSVIVQNQVTPYVRTNYDVNRSSAFYTTCQFCQKKILTKPIKQFNSCTCLFCCCTGCIIYAIVQIIRGKDLCCYDSTHKCPECKQTVAEYSSC